MRRLFPKTRREYRRVRKGACAGPWECPRAGRAVRTAALMVRTARAAGAYRFGPRGRLCAPYAARREFRRVRKGACAGLWACPRAGCAVRTGSADGGQGARRRCVPVRPERAPLRTLVWGFLSSGLLAAVTFFLRHLPSLRSVSLFDRRPFLRPDLPDRRDAARSRGQEWPVFGPPPEAARNAFLTAASTVSRCTGSGRMDRS